MVAQRKVAGVVAVGAGPHWQVNLEIGHHAVLSDEPDGGGGGDAGPAPFGLWLAGLGSCTATTLRMYADRKGWPLEAVRVRLSYLAEDVRFAGVVRRDIHLDGPLTDEQRARLAEIAEKTPVTKLVRAGTPIETRFS